MDERDEYQPTITEWFTVVAMFLIIVTLLTMLTEPVRGQDWPTWKIKHVSALIGNSFNWIVGPHVEFGEVIGFPPENCKSDFEFDDDKYRTANPESWEFVGN